MRMPAPPRGARISRSAGLAAVAAGLLLGACSAQYQPMGPRLAAPHLESDHVIAADGHRLPLRSWQPDGQAFPEPRAVVVAIHGLNDYAQAYAEAGPAWAAKGIATYAYDQRGFGGTENPGIWSSVETLVSDAAAVTGLVAAENPGVPLFLLGESMGGGVALALLDSAEAPEVSGAVLVAPAVWSREIMHAWQRWGLNLGVSLVPGMEMTGEGLAIQPTDNREVLEAMRDDPLVLKANRVDLIGGAVDMMSAGDAAAPDVDVPLLVLFGANEDVLPEEAVDRAIERLQPLAEVTPEEAGNHLTSEHRALVVYPEGWHMLLRDLQRARVVGDVAHWILARAGNAAS